MIYDISPDLTNKHVRRKRSSLGDHPWYVLPTVFFWLSAQTSLKIQRNRVSYGPHPCEKQEHKHHGTHEKTRVKTPEQAEFERVWIQIQTVLRMF